MASKKNAPKRKSSKRGVETRSLLVEGKLSAASRKAILWMIGILAFALYANTLKHSYALDDHGLILGNTHIEQGVAGIPDLLSTSYRNGAPNYTGEPSLYRPLSLVTFAIEYEFSPGNPALGHFINVFLYVICLILLYKVLERVLWKHSPFLPAVICLLFLAHPIHTEVVANLKSRDELMGFLFVMMAFLACWRYFEQHRSKDLIYGGIWFFLALLSKESSLNFLFLLPLTVWFFGKSDRKSRFRVGGILLAGVATFFLIRILVLGGLFGAAPVHEFDNVLASAQGFGDRLASSVYILGRYLGLLFFPHPLSNDYSLNEITIVGLGNWRFLLSFVVYLGLLVFAILRIKKKDVFSYGILFYLGSMFLVSNLVFLIGTHLGERLLFLPSLGFCILVATVMVRVFNLSGKNKKGTSWLGFVKANRLFFGVFALLFVLMSIKTVSRNPDWKDNYALFARDVRFSPLSAKNHYNHGTSLLFKYKQEQNTAKKAAYLKEAIAELQESTRIYPDKLDAQINLGRAYEYNQQIPVAIQHYEKGLSLDSSNTLVLKHLPAAYVKMGEAESDRGNLALALTFFQKADHLAPNDAGLLHNIGSALGNAGDYNKAYSYFHRSLRISPDNADAYYYIGMIFQQNNLADSASYYFDRAFAINPSLRP